MLQSFLIVRDRPSPKKPPPLGLGSLSLGLEDEEPEYAEDARFDAPDALLSAAGLRVRETVLPDPLSEMDVSNVDAVIFCVAYSSLLKRAQPLESRLPVLWWCENEPVVHNCVLSDAIDGMLYPGLTVSELHWALLLSSKHYLSRTQWKQEREQLIARLEDRKWIDRAKSILSEVKSITEAEAYEFLRKQAMNERRRMVDVAVSIVKVYSLLREQNPRGRPR